ncbi:virulence RhuM family protein [bacterium]|nr:virulence RhuM family protein [bacterium]
MENEIIIYQPDETIKLDVRFENETVWLNRRQMAELFGRDIKTIGKHIANSLSEELFIASGSKDMKDNPVVAKFATTANDGKTYIVEYYCLDVILSVGYRVKSPNGIIFRRWANNVLKKYLMRGYAFNSQLNYVEDKFERKISQQNKKIEILEDKINFFVKTSLPPRQGVFYDGQVFDADVFLTKHILSAKRSLVLIDNYVDITTLEMLAKKGKGVSLEIVTSKRGNELAASDIKKFNEQYGDLVVRESAKFHDRFLIIDDKELFLIGASIKDLGRKCFAFTKLDSREISGLKSKI